MVNKFYRPFKIWIRIHLMIKNTNQVSKMAMTICNQSREVLWVKIAYHTIKWSWFRTTNKSIPIAIKARTWILKYFFNEIHIKDHIHIICRKNHVDSLVRLKIYSLTLLLYFLCIYSLLKCVDHRASLSRLTLFTEGLFSQSLAGVKGLDCLKVRCGNINIFPSWKLKGE